MWLLINNNDHISSLNTWCFVTLTMQSILTLMRRTLINADVKNLRFFANFLTIASFTLVFFINNLTLTSAFVTGTSTLSVHTRSNHLHFSDHTTALTLATRLYGTFFTTFSIALLADSFSIDLDLSIFTFVNLFKGTFKRVYNRLGLLGARLLLATSSHTSEDTTKHITHVGSTTTAL